MVDLDLIERIYGILYRQKVSGSRRHRLLGQRTIEACAADAEAVDLTLRDHMTGDVAMHRYDLVILATGYERTSHHRLLAPLAAIWATSGSTASTACARTSGCRPRSSCRASARRRTA